jgi:hypothetical protein
LPVSAKSYIFAVCFNKKLADKLNHVRYLWLVDVRGLVVFDCEKMQKIKWTKKFVFAIESRGFHVCVGMMEWQYPTQD